MTTINDPIRQASMYTMHGLTDPRFFEPSQTFQPEKKAYRKKWSLNLGITALIEGMALRRSVFRYKRLKA